MTFPAPNLLTGNGVDEDEWNDNAARLNDLNTRIGLTRLLGSDLDNDDVGDTASTTYTPNLNNSAVDPVQTDFTAPPSGSVHVHLHAFIDPQVNDIGFVGFQVTRISDGTVMKAAADLRAVDTQNTNEKRLYGQWPVTGLTPGTGYRATMMFKSAAGGSIFINPHNLWVTAL